MARAILLGLLLAGCKSPADGTVFSDGAIGDSKSINRDAANRDDAADAAIAAKPDLPGPTACPGDTLAASRGKAESCTCDSECRSGFCSDGVCCTSACTEGCKACNLPSSLGDCGFIPAGVKPVDSDSCSASTPATCGLDGTCDGQGACRKYAAGIPCKAGTCDGDGISGAKTCDGQGSCSVDISTPCAPYSCDASTNQCEGDCTTNAQCSAGQQCALRSCGMKLNGFVCKADSDCASGHCANGTCCNLACTGACLSCDQPGSVGRCKFIDAGLPDAKCKAGPSATCGTTGLCDGAGACALFPENTPCGAATCAGSVLLDTARVCDGQGTCRAAQLVDCSPYLCSGGECNASCTSDADCEPGHQCVSTTVRGTTTGRCGLKKNGQSCSYPGDCESNQCVDGVCCESACDGPCRSCALPGSPGRCGNVASGAADPRNTCVDEGKSSCGTDGLCDGAGACRTYAPGTVCGTQTCQAGIYTAASTCSQSGACVPPLPRACDPFICNGSSCYSACATNSHCAPGKFCVNGSCGLKNGGAECSSGSECQSSHCAQGVCCNSPCTGACMACNLSAAFGFCTPVPDGTSDPGEQCKATAQATCGTTGLCKAGVCAFYAKGLNCKAAVCATSSSQTPASTCDGRGACVTPPPLNCGRYICSSAACESTCKTDADCVSPNICVNNSCGLKKNGGICTAGIQCESTFCTDGYCCDKSCSPASTGNACMSCKVAGKEGTCSIMAESCVIAGVCYTANAVNSTNACQQCAPETSQTAWTPKAKGVTCRASTGSCDTAEVCDGTGAACPGDGFVAKGTVCRASTGVCDVAETCTGTSAACPGDRFASSSMVCGTSSGDSCDVAATCTGTGATCPANAPAPASTVCRPKVDVCDMAETCTGTSRACPTDTFASAETVCGTSSGPCDVAATCTGTGATCPANAPAPASTVCRPKVDVCDVAETCTGTSRACPTDTFASADTVCGTSSGPCDAAATCTGTGATCPTNTPAPASTVCRPKADVCDVAETCTGTSRACPTDTFASADTVCGTSSGPCDVAATCTGTGATCPANTPAPATTVCRPSVGSCDVAENCTGTTADCPGDLFQPDGTPCNPADVCTTCLAGSCAGTLNCDASVCNPATGCQQE
jgi:hypothetical protein